MNDDVVLKEKLRPPEVAGLARERLEKPLREGPLTALKIVVAPAGSGKTTLLSRVARTARMPVGWYRLTADDASEQRLVAHLVRALAPIASLKCGATIDELLKGLDQWSGAAGLLILDDLHEIAATSAEPSLERLVTLRPPQLQLIFGSRRVPEVNVPRLRVSRTVREIGGDDLRFRSWEVEELFATVYREPLRPEAAAALTRRTGGWAAGLQLFHLSTTNRTAAERHQAVVELGGRSKLVRSYLTRNVLAELPADRRQFLLRTCTLGRLSGPACDALLGTGGSHRILEELEDAQLFTSTDDGGTFFRYHEVLQSHLELALVEECGAAEARSWYQRSGEVLASLGDRRAAARAYAKAGNWNAVSQLVKQQGGTRIDASDLDDDRLLPASTWHVDPWLALANARRLAREGALQPAVDAYRHAQSLYEEPNYQQLCRTEIQAVGLWLPRSTTASQPQLPAPAPPHWSAVLREALWRSPDFATLPVPAPHREARRRLGYGLAALTAGELRRARDVLDSIDQDRTADAMAIISARFGIAAFDLLLGNPTDAVEDLSKIAALADGEGLTWIARLSRGLRHAAIVGSQDANWWHQCCRDIIRIDDYSGDEWGAAAMTFAVALAKQRAEDASGSIEFGDAAARFKRLDAPVLELWCQLLSLRGSSDVLAARRVLEASRALRTRGAEALALALVSANSSERKPTANDLAVVCGVELLNDVIGRNGASGGGSPDGGPESSGVRVFCFGDYRLEINGQIMDLASLRPQARNVLQLLSLSPGHDHHRELIEDILWPGVDHSIAGHRLQVAVSSIRSILGADTVRVGRRGEHYRLCLPAGAAVDVVQFEKALTEAAAASARGDIDGRIDLREQALALYPGDLLPEFWGTEHVESERQRLRRRAAAAAAALASDYRERGEFAKAMDVAQRSVDLDPEQEIPWLMLAELHEKAGDHVSADHVRREHSRIQAELTVSAR
jgi:DNA-binding SARP family transcriptional activator